MTIVDITKDGHGEHASTRYHQDFGCVLIVETGSAEFEIQTPGEPHGSTYGVTRAQEEPRGWGQAHDHQVKQAYLHLLLFGELFQLHVFGQT